jgi:Na+-translocating ferredoxin:NAD+ oxidoreductase RnfD subunit
MSAPAVAGLGRPTLRIRGRSYPVLLPTPRDPRLHLAVVITSLQVLGQLAFAFRLSIAQILVALLTAAVLEVAIVFRSRHVIMWPASALLTGNGVAFVLRVPGTEHGDWWSLRGAWIFAATSAVALLSKHVIRIRGDHFFNPSNIGLVLCFLLLGPELADPLELWWGPISPALALAVAIIVAGGFAILGRLRLLEVAVGFWLAFAAGIALLAASGHAMTAPWHVGPVEGAAFWWVLVTSPEILVFLFFMITDPKTTPGSRSGRRAYAVGVGLLSTLLIAPQTTEFGTKVAVLAALALVCALRLVFALLRSTQLSTWSARAFRAGHAGRAAAGAAALTGTMSFAALVVVAGTPARPEPATTEAARVSTPLPEITVVQGAGIAPVGRSTAQRIARDVLVDLRAEADALRRRSPELAAEAASGAWLAELWERIRRAGTAVDVPMYDVRAMRVTLEPAEGQSPPKIVADMRGTMEVARVEATPANVESRSEARPFRRKVALVLERGRYRIASSRGGMPSPGGAASSPALGSLRGTRLADVAREVGLRFRHGAFRFGVSNDATAMMGGGICWLDYDGNGWLDLFVVNSYAETDLLDWEANGGLPRTALFRNVGGRFEDVSRRAGAALPVRGNGCVAADFDLDGHTDLYVTTAGYNVATDAYDALLWNDGDGTFTEGAREAGITAFGWHAGAAAGDVNLDGLPDLVVTGYTDVNAPIATSSAGFPSNHRAVRDLLYLNEGPDGKGRVRFREVGRRAGLEPAGAQHGLGAVLTDVDRDGRLDLYVANDADPNQLYLNVPWPGGAAVDPAGLGFRFQDASRSEGVDDPNAGMGIAVGDFSLDGRPDLVVTNSRGQLHAVFRSRPAGAGPSFADARPDLVPAFGSRFTGWGATWADLDLDTNLDLVLANGAIPVRDLGRDAQHVQVLANLAGRGEPWRFADASAHAGLRKLPRVNGRGLAAADYDNDGDLDLAVNSIGGRLVLLENRGSRSRGHWLEVQTRTFAPGAVVTVELPDGRTLVRAVTAGSSYLSSEDPRVHIGLGDVSRVRELRVRFPHGGSVRRANVGADRIVVVGR